MNDKISKLPKFKYHPNIYDKEKVLDGVRFDNNVCQCCGNKTDVYVSTMYCCENIDCICMECGHNELDMEVCPNCGSHDITEINRVSGYLGYSRIHGDTRFNESKRAELRDRKSM